MIDRSNVWRFRQLLTLVFDRSNVWRFGQLLTLVLDRSNVWRFGQLSAKALIDLEPSLMQPLR